MTLEEYDKARWSREALERPASCPCLVMKHGIVMGQSIGGTGEYYTWVASEFTIRRFHEALNLPLPEAAK